MSENQKKQGAVDQVEEIQVEEITRGFEEEISSPNGVPKKQQTPNEEVPNVGDQEKRGPLVPPTRTPEGEREDEDNHKEESLSDIVSQDESEQVEPQPETQEAK